ncbi:ribonuclease J [Rhodovarius crocodyli]|uniref:Ribonuclease J n=1 Tax=Rhodovarius crocodyli TaxID=1979269 RepID=A0A437MCQ4_9PROT|nr:ribonuclease J [Rhodovarius crocodyli]RVT95412.1 ribonuclease J [Rhodovarius crocodyli]
MTDANHDLAFIPLGGTGEIGMNLNVYRCDGSYLAVDCGLGFGGNDNPEVDVMVPDPAWLSERKKRLAGLVITHAHEDHIGAVAHLWKSLGCPIWGTPFVISVLRRKLGEVGLGHDVELNTVKPGGRFKVENFDCQFLHVSHSIPEAQALVLRTPYGTLVHTGDWKMDPEPLIGPQTDEAGFAAVGEEGVLAMICDSTNVFEPKPSGSEAEVRRGLAHVVSTCKGRIAVTCFATNVARVESIALAAQAAGRKVALFGRSLRNAVTSARECGYLTKVHDFITEEEAQYLSDRELLLICTGSQGEERSAMAKIAADNHPNIALGEGDTVIFSARMIPGNERAVLRMQDELTRAGCEVITPDDAPGGVKVHCSGHPSSAELKRLYSLVKPKYAVPTHGEWRHLSEHAGVAEECGAEAIIVEDGDVLRLAPGKADVVGSAPVGRLAVDGNRLLPLEGGVLGARKRMLYNGVVVASLAVDRAGKVLGQPKVAAPGLYEADGEETDQLAGELTRLVRELPNSLRGEDDALREAVRAALRKAVGRRLKKRPNVEVHLLRV